MKRKKYSTGQLVKVSGGLVVAAVLILATSARTMTDGNILELRIGVARAGGGYSVTTVPIETYVARVLTGEALPDSQPAALEALAITIRTYALANRSKHAADGFELCDETHCQVMRTTTPATERAAAATAGRVLLDNGAPASIYYSASCGGRTEVPSAVWPGASDPPFLPTQPDDACARTPAWAAELSRVDLQRAFQAGGFRGDRLREMRILEHNASGRVSRLRLEGLQPNEITGQDLRVVVGRTLGWQHIKSTAFELTPAPDGYRFSGHGSGHGVGLCVIGSARLAEAGTSADAILHRYFPGLTIAVPTPRVVAENVPTSGVARSGVSIALPAGDEGDRESITDLALRSRDGLARLLGVDAARVTIHFHSTVESYEQVTAHPWFTFGTVMGNEIHLLPASVLRNRGTLEQTLRHELVRVLTGDTLAGRPLWVREGAAAHYSITSATSRPPDSSRRQALARTLCPSDSALLRPASLSAFNDASARARSCFERQLAEGRSWRDVR